MHEEKFKEWYFVSEGEKGMKKITSFDCVLSLLCWGPKILIPTWHTCQTFSSSSGRLPGTSIVLRSCDRLFRLESSTAPVAWLASGAAVLFLHLLVPGFEYQWENLFPEEGQSPGNTHNQRLWQRQRNIQIQRLVSGAAVLFLHLLIHRAFNSRQKTFSYMKDNHTRTNTKTESCAKTCKKTMPRQWGCYPLLLPGFQYQAENLFLEERHTRGHT